eukprot:8530779-Lingulodinium_polyedra.AAC.1
MSLVICKLCSKVPGRIALAWAAPKFPITTQRVPTSGGITTGFGETLAVANPSSGSLSLSSSSSAGGTGINA